MKSQFYQCALFLFIMSVIPCITVSQIITELEVYNLENAQDWSIETNLQNGDLQFGDRSYTIESIPDRYKGIDWIRTANDSKAYTGDTLVTFQVTGSAEVLVAFDDRLTLREWLQNWTDTGDNIENSETQPKTFSLYKKTFKANNRVVLGGVGQTSGANNYTILCTPAINSTQVPDPFDFLDRFDVARNGEIISETITITGLEEASPVSILKGAYSINGGPFQSTNSFIYNEDRIEIRLHSSSEYGQVTTTKITIGGISADFSIRTEDDPDRGWAEVPMILNRIQKPLFPDCDFLITDYGAIGDGLTDCTDAFIEAISACHDSGGGRVVVPDGEYIMGAIHLKSNVNLYLQKNAKVRFSTTPDTSLFPLVYTRFEGTECYNYSPSIYAFEQENIAITGQGTLDGQGSNNNWWAWKSMSEANADVAELRNLAEAGVPVDERIYGPGHYLRPNMIQPYRCSNVLIDSVTVLNGPMWHIHPVLCENVSVTNVTVIGHGPNNDGCNPESCRDVLIKGCYFDTGDDCIAIKSGRNSDGRRVNVPTENVVIQNCTMKDGHGGVVIGSEISGSARNIFAEDCDMDSPNLDRALRIKTNAMRGGIVEQIYLRNIAVGQVDDAAFRVNFNYGEGDNGDFTPVVRDVEVRNMVCDKSDFVLRMDGYARSPITQIRLINCSFNNAAYGNILNHIQNIALNQVSINGEIYYKILEPAEDSSTTLEHESESMQVPESIQLMQNRPNPFNPFTRIQYSINTTENVDLTIFNTLGQKVKSLVHENMKRGIYAVQWDGSNEAGHRVVSGIYLVRLKVTNRIVTKRIILLK